MAVVRSTTHAAAGILIYPPASDGGMVSIMMTGVLLPPLVGAGVTLRHLGLLAAAGAGSTSVLLIRQSCMHRWVDQIGWEDGTCCQPDSGLCEVDVALAPDSGRDAKATTATNGRENN